MKVNIDKEKLLKHKFWIVLGLAIPIMLFGIYFLSVTVAAEIESKRTKLMSELKGLKNAGAEAFSKEDLDKLEAALKTAQKRETELWSRVFAEQASEFTWPDGFEKIYPMHTGKFIREIKFVTAEAPGVPDDAEHFTGTIVENENKYIVVKNDAGKSEKFHRVHFAAMKLGDGVDFFNIPHKKVEVTFQTARYFYDKLHEQEQLDYAKYYASQIRKIIDIVDPVNAEGEGVVQLRGWPVPTNPTELPKKDDAQKFLRFVPDVWKLANDISEEAWLAQEDLWIQRDLYRAIRKANDDVGVLTGSAVEGTGKEAVYKNPYFELKLKLVNDTRLQVTIRNLRNNRQKLEVRFRVRFNKDTNIEPEKILIEGEPLDPVGTVDANKVPKDVLVKDINLAAGAPRTGIYSVSQVLTWESAAVRRIDHIVIGAMDAQELAPSHRTFPEGVRPYIKEEPNDGALGGPAGPGGPVPGGEGGRGGFPGGFPGPGGLKPGLPNGLVKERYAEVTEQSRRLPIAVALIVDQDHLDRVLTALGNTKFRFLINQVLVNRYPGSLRPQVVAKNLLNPGGPGPFVPVPRPPRGGEGGPGPGAFQPFPGAGMMQEGEETIEANIELVVYGTVTIYERFPARPRPVAAEAPKQ